jgi:hypothetical protein
MVTARRFWLVVGISGILLFLGGLGGTIALVAETGQKVPDSQCSDSRIVRPATAFSVCYTSDDPAVLIGVFPALAGIPLAIFGFKRWASASDEEYRAETAAAGDGDSGSGESDNPLQKILNARKRAKGR